MGVGVNSPMDPKILESTFTLASVSSVDHRCSYLHVQSVYVFQGILNARHFKCLAFKIQWVRWKSCEFPENPVNSLNSKKFPDFSPWIPKNSLTFHWLWQELRFSLTFCKIPWLFPDFETFLFFSDRVATLMRVFLKKVWLGKDRKNFRNYFSVKLQSYSSKSIHKIKWTSNLWLSCQKITSLWRSKCLLQKAEAFILRPWF